MENEKKEKKEEESPFSYLKKGSKVEVLSKEQGSQGAWFPATVLDPPTATISKRHTLTSNKVLVQYKSFVSDKDPTKPHVERTTVSLLRPEPPFEEEKERWFEVSDVVEAFYMDAWWPGVVMSGVVGDKYMVGFKEPPDLLELGRNLLRSLWDWDNGVWTRAPKLVTRESYFKSWIAIEVNLDKHNLWSSWLPAIYIGQLGGDSFLVQYRYKTVEGGNENGLVRVVVAEHQIRPRPPWHEEKEFGFMHMVDAFDDMGWWVGDVTKVLPNRRYIVTFRSTKEEKEFSQSQLRHHLEWIGKQWTSSFSEFHSTMDCGGQSRLGCDNSNNSVGKTPCYPKFRMKQLSPCMDKLPDGKTRSRLDKPQHPNDDAAFEIPTSRKKWKSEVKEDSSSLAGSFRRKSSTKTVNMKGLFTDDEKNEQQQVRQLDSQAITSVVKKHGSPKLQLVRHRKKGVPRKLHGKTSTASMDSENVLDLPRKTSTVIRESVLDVSAINNGSELSRADQEYIEDEHVMNKIESVSIQSEPEAIEDSHAGSQYLFPVKEKNYENEDGVSGGIQGKEKQAELHAQHSKDPVAGTNDLLKMPAVPRLATYQRKRKFKSAGMTHNGIGGVPAVELPETTVEHIGNPAGAVNQQENTPKLPFVKVSPFWEHLEAMEIFKKNPQQPHFHPLLKIKEVLREGTAIGCMAAFASLVEKISKLRVNDPTELIESHLQALVDMELMGFDVKAIRHRLTELQGIKVKLGKLQNRSKQVKIKLIGNTHDTTTYDKTISEIDRNIKDLQEKRVKVMSVKEAKLSETGRLQAEVKSVNEDIQSIQSEFGKLVAAEW